MRTDPDDAIRFAFPCKTVSESNERSHPFERARRVKEHRKTAGWQTRAKVDHRELLATSDVDVTLTRVAPSGGQLEGRTEGDPRRRGGRPRRG